MDSPEGIRARSLSNIKKSSVQRGEDISKKNGEMSSNFGEIIKKLYFFLVWWKASQRATHATPHLSASRYRIFYMWWTASANSECEIYLRESLAKGGGGRGDLRNIAIRYRIIGSIANSKPR